MSTYDDMLAEVQAELGKGEPVRYSGFGTFEIKPKVHSFILKMLRGMVRNGLFAITDKRLVLSFKKGGRARLIQFPYTEVQAVSIGRGFLGAHLDLVASDSTIRLHPLNQAELPAIEALIHRRLKPVKKAKS